MFKSIFGSLNGWLVILGVAYCVALVVWPELATASVVKSGFENKMTALQHKFSTFILPVMSVLGLVMAAILAATGNENAKSKIMFCLMGSGVGFLAPYIIGWIQGILS
jgi:hypothetical protein